MKNMQENSPKFIGSCDSIIDAAFIYEFEVAYNYQATVESIIGWIICTYKHGPKWILPRKHFLVWIITCRQGYIPVQVRQPCEVQVRPRRECIQVILLHHQEIWLNVQGQDWGRDNLLYIRYLGRITRTAQDREKATIWSNINIYPPVICHTSIRKFILYT